MPTHDPTASRLSRARQAPNLRRYPTQRRSRQGVERLLDATADLLATIGYEETTTRAIAAHAGVAVGSLYRFFPDKDALVRALSLRYLIEAEAEMRRIEKQQDFSSWISAVDEVIHAAVRYFRERPAWREIWLKGHVEASTMEAEAQSDDQIALSLQRLVERLAGLEESPTVLTTFRVAMHVADHLLQFAFQRDPEGDPEIIEEARQITRDYLTKHVTARSSADPVPL